MFQSVIIYLTSFICFLYVNGVFWSHGLRTSLHKMQSPLTGGCFYISRNIMSLGILTHQMRLADLAPNSWNLQNDSSFKKHSGCFYHVPGLKSYLSVYSLPLLSFRFAWGVLRRNFVRKVQEVQPQ